MVMAERRTTSRRAEWYEKAADKGDEGAKANLEKLSVREAAAAARYAEALQLSEALATKERQRRRSARASPARGRRGLSATWHGTPCLHEDSPKR